jgi:site-specific recombinase XerD
MTYSWILDEEKYLKIEEVKILRDTCRKLKQEGIKRNNPVFVRDWFMIELGLFTGLRVEEMADLNCGDLLIDNAQSSLIVRKGKGNKKRVVLLNPVFKKECLWFLKYKQSIHQEINENSCVLCSIEGNTLTKRALQKDFKRTMKKAGLPDHYSIHSLRHTFGSHLYKSSNHNLRLVQQQLGHSSIRTTEVYASLMAEDTKEAIKNLYK